MSCDKFRAQLTAYLDGELADERGSAVRGHLRTCEACRQAATDEAALRDGLRALEPVDPPASLWSGVQQRLAAAEVADAERPAWRRALVRWMPRAPQLAFGAAALAAVLVLLAVKLRNDDDDTRQRTVSAPTKIEPVVIAPGQAKPLPPAAVASSDDARDVTEVLATQPARITEDYAAAARELMPIAQEARARWTEDQQREFDQHVAELQQQITAAGNERARQRGYRALTRYLQRAAIRDDVALAAIGGAQ